VFNFGAGVDVFLSPKTTLILSVSSDYNAHVSSVNLLDELNQNESNVNVLGDFWHFGVGTDLSVKWGSLYTGFVYSQTSTDIEKSPDFLPEDIGETVKGGLGSIEYQRMRFIIGIDLPLFNKKLEKLNGTSSEKK